MAITYHAGRRIQSTQNASQSTSSSGSSANATNGSNGFSAVTGLIGQGYSQSSGIYRIDTAPVLGTEWSFNFWTNPQAASGNDYYLQMTADTSPRNSVFYIYNHNTDGLNMSVHDSTGTKVNISTDDSEMWVDMTNGSWNMITMTWNNTDKKLRSYKNGVLYETGKAMTHTNAGNMGTSNKVWAIGNYDNQTGSTYASRANALDEWSFWSGTLSQADITELYNGGSGIKATALSSANKLKLNVYYDFEDTVNGTLTNQAPETAIIADVKPTDVELGSRFEETNTRKIYSRMDSDYVTDKWFELGTVPYAGGRAVFGGGINTGSSAVDTIDYITIATLGNADTFGDLSQARYGLGAMANKTRTLFAGGNTGGGNQTTIDFITPATLGDATTFGNISNDTSKTYGVMCLSSETRGIIAGGESGYSNRIDYVTIDTEGNSTSFPDGSGGITTLTVAGKQGATTSDGTRGVFMGGEGRTPTMDYITIDTAGVCTDFGDLRETLYGGSHGLATDGTIGVFTTGNSYSSNVEKITIQTLGNSTNFGNMDTGRSNLGLASDKTRAIFAGGKTASGNNYTNTIEHSAIPTPSGNASDFGDLQVARQVLAGASDIGADRS